VVQKGLYPYGNGLTDKSADSDTTSLNITAASRVYLMEPQWNPNIEAQALARVHRFGQTREVTTVRLIMEDSIESVSWTLKVFTTALPYG
jgi:hypothetical protein